MTPGQKRVVFFTVLVIAELTAYFAFRNAYAPGQRLHLAAQLARIGASAALLYGIWPVVRRSGVLAYSAVLFGCILAIPGFIWIGNQYEETRTPAQPREIIELDDAGSSFMGYRIGAAFDLPECTTKVVDGYRAEYVAPTSSACFRHMNSLTPGAPLLASEMLLVDRLDIARHYANVNWILPECVLVEHGRVLAVAAHIDMGRAKPVTAVEVAFAEALHGAPRVSTWTRSNQRELTSFVGRVWKRTDMVFAILTEERHSANGRGGLPSSAMIIAAKQDILYRFNNDGTRLEGDCPAIESTSDTGL
ncbi:hypothetical protein [Paraburkholderia bannensis]|uniref:hypothetical protein n=1 Tax=Paraburkholderia bannensis TaxID=765414 RepID=UPI002AC31F76|nr:hypothetical protein [Paraburkholderia bannensis]